MLHLAPQSIFLTPSGFVWPAVIRGFQFVVQLADGNLTVLVHCMAPFAFVFGHNSKQFKQKTCKNPTVELY